MLVPTSIQCQKLLPGKGHASHGPGALATCSGPSPPPPSYNPSMMVKVQQHIPPCMPRCDARHASVERKLYSTHPAHSCRHPVRVRNEAWGCEADVGLGVDGTLEVEGSYRGHVLRDRGEVRDGAAVVNAAGTACHGAAVSLGRLCVGCKAVGSRGGSLSATNMSVIADGGVCVWACSFSCSRRSEGGLCHSRLDEGYWLHKHAAATLPAWTRPCLSLKVSGL